MGYGNGTRSDDSRIPALELFFRIVMRRWMDQQTDTNTGQTPKSKFIILPFNVLLYGTLSGRLHRISMARRA